LQAGELAGKAGMCEGDSPANDLCTGAAVLGFTAAGAGLGALVGAFNRGEERWEPLPPDAIRLGEVGQAR